MAKEQATAAPYETTVLSVEKMTKPTEFTYTEESKPNYGPLHDSHCLEKAVALLGEIRDLLKKQAAKKV